MKHKIWPVLSALLAAGAAGGVLALVHGNATRPVGSTVSRSGQAALASPVADPVKAIHAFRLTGARDGASRDRWLLTNSRLAVTRNNGGTWKDLKLPAAAGNVADVSVLCSGVAAVTGTPGGDSISVDTSEGDGWTSRRVTVGAPVASAAIVDDAGTLKGVMVNTATGGGVWLRASDDDSSWRSTSTPIGGAVTAARGNLWLTGEATNASTLYRSGDDGSAWTKVSLPVRSSSGVSAAALSDPEGSDGAVALTATSGSKTQVITGTDTDGRWTWHAGPTLSLGGSYGSETPARATAVAGGVLWVLSPTNELARVTLATGKVTETKVTGLPANGELELSASSADDASADYSTTTCADDKTACTTSKGIMTTTDGGRSWHAVPAPATSSSR